MNLLPRRRSIWASFSALLPLVLPVAVHADVFINEFQAEPNGYVVEYDLATGMPRIGYGPAWWEKGFYDAQWPSGVAPIGHTLATGLTTNLGTAMDDKTAGLYTRKTFTVAANELTQATDLILKVWYDDGFIAILNGKEVTRANLGPAKQVTYHDQVAYRDATVTTATSVADVQPGEFNLGPLSQWLVAGENVLAFQIQNRDLGGGCKFDANLYSVSAASYATVVDHNFDNANGASVTHQRQLATVTNTPTGTPTPGSWLAVVPNPTSDAAWPNLTITTSMPATAGAGNSGYLKYDLTQSAASALAASIYTPPVNLAGQITPGALTSEQLSRVEVNFRYKTTVGATFGFRVEPVLGTTATALTGFPNVTMTAAAAEDAAAEFATASGGFRTRVVNASGSATTSSSGLVRFTQVLENGPNLKNTSFRYTELNTAGAGNGGTTGCIRLDITDPPDSPAEQDYLQYSRPGYVVRGWTAGGVTAVDLGRVNFNFAYQLPSGAQAKVWLEPDNAAAGYGDRADFGTITGTGAWQTFDQPFSAATNTGAMLTKLNSVSTTAFRVYFRIDSTLPVGQAMLIDTVGFNASWRTYSTFLSSASAASITSFLGAMNTGLRTTCQPVFSKASSAISPAVDTISIEDFKITYRISGGAQQWAPAASTWKYFIGRYEPNGGVVDPAELALATYEGDLSDWVELKNDGPSAVNIGGWALTDDPDLPLKWTFPASTSIPSGGFLVVLCDGRDNTLPGAQYLHTNFTLKNDAEHITLRDPIGSVVSDLSGYPKQNGFHTYGLNPSGTGERGYLRHGTPGRENTGPFSLHRVKTPDFTPSGGFYTGTIQVSILSETEGATVRYTLDGSEPTTSSSIYYGPFPVNPISSSSGQVVRAKAWLAGSIPSDVKTATFLLDQNTALKSAPCMILTGDPQKSLYTPYGITAIAGGIRDAGGVWIPTTTTSYNNVLGDLNNALTGGQAWERPFTVEWRYADGRDGFNEDAGVRVSGSAHARPRYLLTTAQSSPWSFTNYLEKPSFNIFFRKEYGSKSVSQQMFPRGYPVETFEQLRMRAGKNDVSNPFIVDEFMRRLYIATGQQGSRGVFNTLYINGSFRGVYNTTERLRQPFMQQHFNSNQDWDVRQVTEIANGDATAFNTFVSLMDAYGAAPTDQTKYSTAAAQLDADAYIDYAIVNIWGGTGDWPHNNYVASRERSPTGKWRWFVWDAEGAFGGFSKALRYNVITQDLLVSPTAAGREICRTYTQFSKNMEFRLRFADHLHRHFCNSGGLTDANMTAIRNDVVNEYQPLFSYMFPSGTLSTAWFSNWVSNTVVDKRDALFGSYILDDPATTTVVDPTEFGYQFVKANLWPTTHLNGTWDAPYPPAFGQHGGDVPTGYNLTISLTEPYPTDADRPKNQDNPYRVALNQAQPGREIYFTTDGTDPRLPGGGISPTARLYTGPVALNRSFLTVKSRIRNVLASAPVDIAAMDNRWSPITEAVFRVAAVAPTPSNLVIAEIMYNPPMPSAAEPAWGDNNDFEFIRLLNISGQPVRIADARFDSGVGFDFAFGVIPVIDPDQSLLLVSNLAAFRNRYGNAYDSLIAGEFTGTSLSNSGERLRLRSGVSTTLIDLVYNDKAPWPTAADGDGPSLVLLNPRSAPNHALPESWGASAQPGGLLVVPAAMNFTRWRSLFWDRVDAANSKTDVSGDFDQDGISNLVEFALGSNPRKAEGPAVQSRLETINGNELPILEFRTPQSASGTTVTGQFSTGLTSWQATIPLGPPTQNPDGTQTHHHYAPLPPGTDWKRVFMRAKVDQN